MSVVNLEKEFLKASLLYYESLRDEILKELAKKYPEGYTWNSDYVQEYTISPKIPEEELNEESVSKRRRILMVVHPDKCDAKDAGVLFDFVMNIKDKETIDFLFENLTVDDIRRKYEGASSEGGSPKEPPSEDAPPKDDISSYRKKVEIMKTTYWYIYKFVSETYVCSIKEEEYRKNIRKMCMDADYQNIIQESKILKEANSRMRKLRDERENVAMEEMEKYNGMSVEELIEHKNRLSSEKNKVLILLVEKLEERLELEKREYLIEQEINFIAKIINGKIK